MRLSKDRRPSLLLLPFFSEGLRGWWNYKMMKPRVFSKANLIYQQYSLQRSTSQCKTSMWMVPSLHPIEGAAGGIVRLMGR